MSAVADPKTPEPVGFYCDHSDEEPGKRTHEGWEWTDTERVWTQQPTIVTSHDAGPHEWDEERRMCPRAVPVYAVDAPALRAEVERLRSREAGLIRSRRECERGIANLAAALDAAEIKRDRLSGQVARVEAWVTGDVVTARGEFGQGYREAMRDVRDLLSGTEADR